MTKLDGKTPDLAAENIEQLRQIFPDIFEEGKIDFDKLKQVLGEYVDDEKERYNFTWNGKGKALRLAQTPTTGTLRPCEAESKNWDDTQNLYIEGDNLEVLKLLQKSYHGKIKMIYIDPPYNPGGDFVYPDDFSDSIENYKRITGQIDDEGKRLGTNSEFNGRYHTDWLNMIYPRLKVARDLLTYNGVIFISIDDNEVTNLKKICDETFGEENYAGQFPWRKRTAKSDVPFGVSQDYEWILCYAKSGSFRACLEGGTRKYFETPDFPGRPWRIHDLTTQRSALERPNSNFTMVNPKTGKEYPANPNRTWAITVETFKEYYSANRIVFPGDYDFLNIQKPVLRYWKEDDMEKAGDSFGFIPVSTKLPDSIGMTQDGTKDIADLFASKVFGFPKPVELIKYLVKATTSTSVMDGDIILDFFSGSATTAHAVMQLNAKDGGNRKYILVQLPEVCDEKSEAAKAGYKNICEIGKERIRRAGKKLTDTNGQMQIGDSEKKPLDVGFRVFKLDSSNLQTWDATPVDELRMEDLLNRMNTMINRVKADRSDLDMVCEVMLKLGVPLTYSVNKVAVNSKVAYTVGDDCLLLVCLAADITPEDVEAMAEYVPAKVIISRDSFANDTAMANAYYILRDRGIELKLV